MPFGLVVATRRKKVSVGSLLEAVERKADASSRSGRNRAKVMELKEEIADVLARGYKWKVIWQALCDTGRIDMGYYTFMAHCRAIGLVKVPGTYETKKKAGTKRRKARGVAK